MFLLEPIGIFIRGEKITSDTREQLRFRAHCQLAQSYYSNQRIISQKQFEEIDWPSVQGTIRDLLRLFQIWAANHNSNIEGTMMFLSHQDGRSKLSPSCQMCEETCQHVARCPEERCTLAFEQTANIMERWLKSNNTHPDIQNLLLWYLNGRKSISCLDCATALDLPPIMQKLAISQDIIRWDHFLMGMVSKQIAKIQSAYLLHSNSLQPASLWIVGLITRLLQVTHAQWIYRCVLVPDWNTGTLISAHKEYLLKALGPDGLAKEDKILLKCNFDE
jgi:hypothetical protein